MAAGLFLTGCGADRQQQSVYRQYGINCLREGKYKEAVQYFQKALDQSIGVVSDVETDICYYKAEAQYMNGDTKGAIDTYTAIIDYNEDPQAYYLRGRLYYSIGTDKQKKQADQDFEKAVEEAPKDYNLYIGICEALGDQPKAKEYLKKALDFQGDEPADQMQKGRIYHLLGDNQNAKKYLEKAVKAKQTEGYLYLTQVYQELGDQDSARASFEKYLDSGLGKADDLYNIGLTQMKARSYDWAIECFEKALAMEKVPGRQQIERSRIVAYEYSGDFKTAKKLMKEYTATYPKDTSLDKDRTFLETR